jgi:hypothetical protein
MQIFHDKDFALEQRQVIAVFSNYEWHAGVHAYSLHLGIRTTTATFFSPAAAAAQPTLFERPERAVVLLFDSPH